MEENIYVHSDLISRSELVKIDNYSSKVVWFTGLSGSGKSTIAKGVAKKLLEKQIKSKNLDGDNIRKQLNSDLGFSLRDRGENIRRIKEVAKLFYDINYVTLVSFISPMKGDRNQVRTYINNFEGFMQRKNPVQDFIEVYVDCPLTVLKERDTNGMYKKALAGEISDFTGISSPYEAPDRPEIHLLTDEQPIEKCIDIVTNYLLEKIKL